ncbi:MAG: glycosyltransferase [bacterium]
MITRQEIEKRFLLQDEFMGTNKPVNNINPLVSVSVVTYQHVKYIKQCLDSILQQDVSFQYEIVLSDDGSDDGTTEICKDYAAKYSDRIRLFIRDREITHIRNEYEKDVILAVSFQVMHCRGKYYAVCNGDDYWNDKNKLQKQINFLEKNPDYGMVYSQYKRESVLGEAVSYPFTPSFSGNIFNYLLLLNFIGALTVVARTDLFKKASMALDLPNKRWILGDYPIWLEIASKSKIGLIKEYNAVYRVSNNSAGNFNSLASELKFLLSVFDIVYYFLNKHNCSVFFKNLIWLSHSLRLVLIVSKYKIDRQVIKKNMEIIESQTHPIVPSSLRKIYYYLLVFVFSMKKRKFKFAFTNKISE